MQHSTAPHSSPLVPPGWLELLPSAPLLSSEGLGWSRLAAFRAQYPARFEIQLPATGGHFLSCHLRNPCELATRWNGKLRRSRSLPGEAIIMAAQQENYWDGTGEIDELQIFLDTALLREAAAELGNKSVALIEGIGIRDPVLPVVAARLVEELAHPGPCARMLGDAMAHALTAQLLSRHSNFGSVALLGRIDMPLHKVRSAIDYIEVHLGEDLCIDSMAAAVNMSSFRFARGFKKATGRSPHQFLLERRIEHAKDLLRATDMRLIEIAAAVGFATHSHFASVFRQRCRMSPKRYRELNRTSA